MSKILFITGTDTGVGKTLLTALLLLHLRRSGRSALGMKPFCSGGREDVNLIRRVQGPRPPRSAVNPFYFEDPLAPLAAARRLGRRVTLRRALQAIRLMQRQCDWLIVEGVGGALAPLGERSDGTFAVADLIAGLRADTIVVAPDKLGTLNHTLLTVEALRARGIRRIQVVLMRQRKADFSSQSNLRLLRELLSVQGSSVAVCEFPFLNGLVKQARAGGREIEALEKKIKKLKNVLARILAPASFCPRSSKRA